MNLKIYDISCEGFKSFREETSFSLGESPGLYFLKGENRAEPELGSNGAGKSTLWDLLCWVFFGISTRNLTAKALKSWNEGKGYTGSVSFRGADGADHVLSRSWKPNTLYLDEDKIEQAQATKVLGGLTKEDFLRAVIVPQVSKMFFDLTPGEQTKLFSSVLDLDRWEDRSKKAKSLSKDVLGEQYKIEKDIARIEGELESIDLKHYMRLFRKFSVDRSNRIISLKAHRKSLKSDMSEPRQRIRRAGATLARLSSEKERLREQVAEFEHELSEEFERYMKAQSKQAVLSHQLQSLTDTLDRVTAKEGTECGECGQEVSSLHVCKFQEKTEDKVLFLEGKMSKASKRTKKRSLKVKEFRAEIEELKDKIKKCDSKIERIRSIEAEQQRRLDLQKQKMAAIRSELKDIREQENPYQDIVDNLRQKKKALKTSHRLLSKKEFMLKRKFDRVSYWVKGFKEMKLYIMEEALRQLEVETNDSLYQLGLKDWKIHYSISRETARGSKSVGFNIFVDSPYNDSRVPWESWSGGEAQRLKIAGSMGFMNLMLDRLGVRVDLEVWDEPTEGLSPQGIDDLLGTLSARAVALKKKIWIVDQHSLDYGGFHSIANVVKEEDTGSHIEWEEVS